MTAIETETRKRTIVKALTYRVISSALTGGIAWTATGQMTAAVAIAIGDSILKIGLFYAHERVWTRIHFGLNRPPEYEI